MSARVASISLDIKFRLFLAETARTRLHLGLQLQGL